MNKIYNLSPGNAGVDWRNQSLTAQQHMPIKMPLSYLHSPHFGTDEYRFPSTQRSRAISNSCLFCLIMAWLGALLHCLGMWREFGKMPCFGAEAKAASFSTKDKGVSTPRIVDQKPKLEATIHDVHSVKQYAEARKDKPVCIETGPPAISMEPHPGKRQIQYDEQPLGFINSFSRSTRGASTNDSADRYSIDSSSTMHLPTPPNTPCSPVIRFPRESWLDYCDNEFLQPS
ncbi:hypothetical protein RU639_012654 [Aspergillus parasiticus]